MSKLFGMTLFLFSVLAEVCENASCQIGEAFRDVLS